MTWLQEILYFNNTQEHFELGKVQKQNFLLVANTFQLQSVIVDMWQCDCGHVAV